MFKSEDFQKANEISLMCCVSMWNFKAGPVWNIFPQTPHGGSAGLGSPPWLGWASLMCWFTYSIEMNVENRFRRRRKDILPISPQA